MKKIHLVSLLSLALTGLLALAGCASSEAARRTVSNEANGAKLWAQNCARCHNSRSPTELSTAQWDVVMLHMRVRAGLTAADTHAIREFLQTAD
jgi:mono/diheme cytochrome c family protein